jgi:nucleoside-diphosphate-sugar epimerase
MNIAITGATGCLGTPLVDKLIPNINCLKVLALPNDPSVSLLDGRFKIVFGDLSSSDALNQLTKDCSIVFHLAGKVHSIPRTKEEEQEFYQVNLEGTKNLLEAARKNEVKRFVFYSTVGVYGKDADFYGDELSTCQPNTVYAQSKYQAEQLVLESSKNGGPEGVVLRFPVAYGPMDRGNVASLIRAIHKNYFFYMGDIKVNRSMVSSRNAAEAAYLAAFVTEARDQIFCITDDQDYTIKALVESICSALNITWRPIRLPNYFSNALGKVGDFLEKTIHVSSPVNSSKVRKLSRPLIFSCEKAKKILGYRPVETLVEGISEEVVWLKKTYGWI